MDVARLEFLLRNGGESLVTDVMTIFLDQSPARMSAIRDAVQAKDPKSIQSASHALRSSAIQVGFSSIGSLCLEIERFAAKHEMDMLGPLMDRMEREFEDEKLAYRTWSQDHGRG